MSLMGNNDIPIGVQEIIFQLVSIETDCDI